MTYPQKMVEGHPIVGGKVPQTIGGTQENWTQFLDLRSRTNYPNQLMLVMNVGEATLATTQSVNIETSIQVDKNNTGSFEEWTAKGVHLHAYNSGDNTSNMNARHTVIFNITQEELNEAFPTATYPKLKIRGQMRFVDDAHTGTGWVLAGWLIMAGGMNYGVSGSTNAEIREAYPSECWGHSVITNDKLTLLCTPDGS